MEPSELNTPFQQLINGRWVEAESGGQWDVINPATEEVVATVPYGADADARSALAAARAAQPAWAGATAYERAAFLSRAAVLITERADELAPLLVAESGKPLVQARGELVVAGQLFEWFAEEAKRAYGRVVPSRAPSRRSTVLRQPVGVVGVITAWNFPAYNPARSWAPALAAGCTVVARPSELTPLTAMGLAQALVDAGFPAGVFNLVNGEPGPMADEFLNSPQCRKVSFTGSLPVGQRLLEGSARRMTRLSLELGGNAPALIFADCDLPNAVAGAVQARFRNAGQVCVAPQRFLVERPVLDQFVSQAVVQTRQLRLGAGGEPGVEVGPLITARHRDRVEALVEQAREAGANVLVGGRRPLNHERGFFYEPTVVVGAGPGTALYDEEIFGPVMVIEPFDSFEEAISRANDTPYGLAGYVWCRDLTTAFRAVEALDVGQVGLNDWGPPNVELPFAGRKQSGIGRECGAEGLDDYLEVKSLTMGGF
jgi:acyl-CoA reductase-like NAD-dependent aldehyde dehydrogenase